MNDIEFRDGAGQEGSRESLALVLWLLLFLVFVPIAGVHAAFVIGEGVPAMHVSEPHPERMVKPSRG